jgi:ribonuclease PH
VADVDMNFVMTEDGRFIEIQGTAEKTAFPRKTLDRFIETAERGIRGLMKLQREALGLPAK